jgi:hypothetical protein
MRKAASFSPARSSDFLTEAFVSKLKTIISRTQLYERVWTTPMQKLAQEFGLSDVGLAKLCRRHEIPVSGRGYWARIQFGQKPTRTALVDARKLHTENITIYGSEPQVREALTSDAKKQILKIEVTADRVITHPIVWPNCKVHHESEYR